MVKLNFENQACEAYLWPLSAHHNTLWDKLEEEESLGGSYM